MPKMKRLCVLLPEQLYEEIKLIAEYNGYSDVSEFVRTVLRSFSVALRANGMVALPVAAVPPQLVARETSDVDKSRVQHGMFDSRG